MQDLLDMVLTALHQERGVWNFYHDFPYDVWIFLYMYYLAVTPHVIPLRASFLEDLFAKFSEIWILLYLYYITPIAATPSVVTLRSLFLNDLVAK